MKQGYPYHPLDQTGVPAIWNMCIPYPLFDETGYPYPYMKKGTPISIWWNRVPHNIIRGSPHPLFNAAECPLGETGVPPPQNHGHQIACTVVFCVPFIVLCGGHDCRPSDVAVNSHIWDSHRTLSIRYLKILCLIAIFPLDCELSAQNCLTSSGFHLNHN